MENVNELEQYYKDNNYFDLTLEKLKSVKIPSDLEIPKQMFIQYRVLSAGHFVHSDFPSLKYNVTNTNDTSQYLYVDSSSRMPYARMGHYSTLKAQRPYGYMRACSNVHRKVGHAYVHTCACRQAPPQRIIRKKNNNNSNSDATKNAERCIFKAIKKNYEKFKIFLIKNQNNIQKALYYLLDLVPEIMFFGLSPYVIIKLLIIAIKLFIDFINK